MQIRSFSSLALSMVFLAAAGGPLFPRSLPQDQAKPGWIAVLPQQAGRVYAMGLASFAPTEGQAMTQAAQNARVEVLSRLRANIRSETSIRSTSTISVQTGGKAIGASEQQVGRDTRIEAQATDLPGLVVEETWSDVPGRTAYALAYLDVALAEGELRSRYAARAGDLAQETATPQPPRERLRMLSRLKGAQVEFAKLDDMAALIAAGGGDPGLRGQVRAGRLAVDRQMEALRASLTLSLEPGAKGAAQIASILRNVALKAGLTWSETPGAFLLALDFKSDTGNAGTAPQVQVMNGWWRGGWVVHTVAGESGFIVARGTLELTLKDTAGNPYESVELEAKGVGVNAFQAEQRLKDDLKAKLEKTFSAWLESLVN